ncbi:YceI family protein [Solitalea koreensis]|uniref:Polyisoprenoid-binding protein YceI n=1 Tax=Solitalea koreensis TaxID=543615 RepID=A0A521CJM5_9SPHI|nr:YceI family protein [Solitalea koreensis]SMO59595.1 Polyisoprenoid-binding protein YceI [Solitalea koreensis]
MNKFFTALTMVAATALMSFTTPGKKAETFKVDATKSTVEWNAKKVTGEHSGAIKLATGSLTYDGKTIKGGTFTIDMNSISCSDITDANYNGKLIGHLKNDDFFSTEKFPTAKFDITEVKSTGADSYEISGNLTIKGITKPQTFPATVKKAGNNLVATANLTIDRTAFDIRYGSASFFNVGDKAIANDFTLKISLVASK